MPENVSFYDVKVRGMDLRIDQDILDDMDTVELLGDLQEGEILAFPKLCKKVFGNDGFIRIKEALADENGKTKVSDISEFIAETFQACNSVAVKN